MKGTATLVSPGTPYGVAGQRLYKVDPPVKYDVYEPDRVERETQYVVVSAITARDAGAETYIFPADEGGAHTSGGDPIHPSQFWTSTGGQGHGKCECGALSPNSGGRKYRRVWHVEHKTAIRNEHKEN